MKNAISNRLNLSVQYACNREGLPLRADFVRWARAALIGGGQVTIRLVDADEGRALNAEYRMDLGGAGSMSARVGYSYQSRVVATTEVVYDPVLKTSVAPITQDGYGLVGAGLIWNPNDAWTVSLQGSNLGDKEYRTTGYNLYSALGVHTGFYGPPRQYSLTVRYNF